MSYSLKDPTISLLALLNLIIEFVTDDEYSQAISLLSLLCESGIECREKLMRNIANGYNKEALAMLKHWKIAVQNRNMNTHTEKEAVRSEAQANNADLTAPQQIIQYLAKHARGIEFKLGRQQYHITNVSDIITACLQDQEDRKEQEG